VDEVFGTHREWYKPWVVCAGNLDGRGPWCAVTQLLLRLLENYPVSGSTSAAGRSVTQGDTNPVVKKPKGVQNSRISAVSTSRSA
jgi:hypothetical protein